MILGARRWRRGMAKAARRPVRALRNFRPSPAVGTVLLAVILGSGVAIGVVAADTGHPEPTSSSTDFRGQPDMDSPGRGMHGDMGGPWGHGGPRH